MLTEEEWEYFAMWQETLDDWKFAYAGVKTRLQIDDFESTEDDEDLIPFTWYHLNGPDYMTYKVGKKKPNRLKLYDMSGNVSEWCNDEYYDLEDGTGDNTSSCCSVSCRGKSTVTAVSQFKGFRLARSL